MFGNVGVDGKSGVVVAKLHNIVPSCGCDGKNKNIQNSKKKINLEKKGEKNIKKTTRRGRRKKREKKQQKKKEKKRNNKKKKEKKWREELT